MSAPVDARFAEYATSGAFAIGLTRSQVASLSLINGIGGGLYSSGASLERKGLVEAISSGTAPFGAVGTEYRLTQAGTLVLELCRLAGLANGDAVVAAEIAGLHRDLEEARHQARDARERMTSVHARLQEAEFELEDARREIARAQSPVRLREEFQGRHEAEIRVRLRDPLPDLTTGQVMAGPTT